MNRLRDADEQVDGGGDPLFRSGVELLQRTPATAAAPDEVKARVWRSIRRAAAGPAPTGRRTLFRLAVVAVVALVAGTAGAVIARRWIVPRLDAPAAAPVAAPARPATASPKPSPVRSADLAAAEEPVTADLPAESRSPKAPARNAPKRPASPSPAAAAVARERSEVLDALIALRREHDPVRSGTLLASYLSAHPRGALREEALVLAIEAADARGDRASGEQLAHAYQGEYPAGRFLSFARSHTGAR